jgi:magnesium chelatase subunit I
VEDVTDATHVHDQQTPHPAASTLGQLRESGHELKSLRQELRDNLLERLAAGARRPRHRAAG